MIEKTLPRIVRMLYEGDALIYIATRSFNYIDKIQAERLGQVIDKAIDGLLNKPGLKHKHKVTFVPFRDTNEHKIKGINRTKQIYE